MNRVSLSAAMALMSPMIPSIPSEQKLPELPPSNWSYSGSRIKGVFVDPKMMTLQVYKTSSLNEEERSRLMYTLGGIGSINFSFFNLNSLAPLGVVVAKNPDGTPSMNLATPHDKKIEEVLNTRYCLGITNQGVVKVGLRSEFIRTTKDRKTLGEQFTSFGEGFLGYQIGDLRAKEALKNQDYSRIRAQVNYWNKGIVNGKSAYLGINGSGKINRSFIVIGDQDGREVISLVLITNSTLALSICKIDQMLKENLITGKFVLIVDGGGSASLLKPGFHKHTDRRRLPTMLVIESKSPL